MSFRYESELVAPAQAWLQRQGLLTRSEFAMPWGICDLVGLQFDTRHVKKRLALGQRRPIGPARRVALLARIPDRDTGRSVRLGTLRSLFGDLVSAETITEDLKRLIENKFACRTTRGTYQKLNGWEPLHRRLVAVELKLDRVQDALHQAMANLALTRESYVGMPMDRAARLQGGPNAARFRQANVGLLGIGPNTCRVLIPVPRGGPTRTVPERHCAERFWRSYVKGS